MDTTFTGRYGNIRLTDTGVTITDNHSAQTVYYHHLKQLRYRRPGLLSKGTLTLVSDNGTAEINIRPIEKDAYDKIVGKISQKSGVMPEILVVTHFARKTFKIAAVLWVVVIGVYAYLWFDGRNTPEDTETVAQDYNETQREPATIQPDAGDIQEEGEEKIPVKTLGLTAEEFKERANAILIPQGVLLSFEKTREGQPYILKTNKGMQFRLHEDPDTKEIEAVYFTPHTKLSAIESDNVSTMCMMAAIYAVDNETTLDKAGQLLYDFEDGAPYSHNGIQYTLHMGGEATGSHFGIRAEEELAEPRVKTMGVRLEDFLDRANAALAPYDMQMPVTRSWHHTEPSYLLEVENDMRFHVYLDADTLEIRTMYFSSEVERSLEPEYKCTHYIIAAAMGLDKELSLEEATQLVLNFEKGESSFLNGIEYRFNFYDTGGVNMSFRPAE